MSRGVLIAAVALAALVRAPAWAGAPGQGPASRPPWFEPVSPTAGQAAAPGAPGRQTRDGADRLPSQPATQPRYTLRDPGPLRGRDMPPIVVSRREQTDYSRWLYGLGALALIVAFYLSTRGRDGSGGGRSDAGADARADGDASREADHEEET